MSARLYKIRRFTNGKKADGDTFSNYSLTVPPHIARALPEDLQFSAELTDSGLLYKPIETEPVATPEWVEQYKK